MMRRPSTIPRWLRKRMLSLRALTTGRESECVAAARAAVEDARARAEYFGWNGASSNAYARAKANLKAELRAARAAQRDADPDKDPGEGRGAFGWAILSTLLVIGAAVGAYSAHVLR